MFEKAFAQLPAGRPDPNIPEDIVEIEVDVELDPSDSDLDDVFNLDLLDGVDSRLADSADVPFDANLAEFIPEGELSAIADQLNEFYHTDLESRREWEDTYKEGISLLGLKIESRSEPWEGACGVTHPLLAEAVVRFQAETIMETFPASGPVKTKVIGKASPEMEAAASRVREDMNHWLLDRMPEYRAEHERLLWGLPIAGTALKKLYFNPYEERPVAAYVPAEDFVISYGASDLTSAPRYAHRMRKTRNELRKLQVTGFYRDVELGEPAIGANVSDSVLEAKDDHTGTSSLGDDRYTVLEYHVDLDLESFPDEDEEGSATGIELPYVVHYLLDSDEILAVYRNWDEGDERKRKIVHFAKYSYIPGFGFYDFGLIHLVGGFAKGATSLLRQLVDAGSLSNLPGGLKSRGLRIKGDDSPIAPGEFRDVDVPSGSIRDNIMPLPYKEPSQVLFNLLSGIVSEGRRFAAIADVNVADMQPNTPVGSTLAILERTLKTMSAIQARVHAAMKVEFNILKSLVRDYMPTDYPYDPETGESTSKAQDYDSVEIIPVSDPNASTLSQRIAQYQAALQLAQTAPQLYDMAVLHRQMLEVLGIRNVEKILPTEEDIQRRDPVSENMEIVTGKPVKAFMDQDHESHIGVHMKFGEDPSVQKHLGNHPNAQALTAALASHIAEHVAFQYRRQIEFSLGVPLPHPDVPLAPDVEVEISRLSAAAADKVLNRNKLQMSQEQAQEQAQDPIVQMQMQEVQIKAQEVQRKAQKDQQDFQLEQEWLRLEQAKINVPPTPPKPPEPPDPVRIAEVQIKEQEVQRKTEKDAMDHFIEQERLRLEAIKVAMMGDKDSKARPERKK